MKVAVFSTKPYDREFLEQANSEHGHELSFLEAALDEKTAPLAEGFPAVCGFTNDWFGRNTLEILAGGGTGLIALRCAGFNQVDLEAAAELEMTVARVPEYSPYAIAEHTVGLMLMVNRKLHRAYARVREGNFSLHNLMGFDLRGKTVGIVGTGKIGTVLARILQGFGCRLLAFDPKPNEECRSLSVRYVELGELLRDSDVISLHCPLTPKTHHLIDDEAVRQMKPGVLLVNTSRGAVVDTRALIRGLKSGHIGGLALDVYEEEGDLFFKDLSGSVIQDDVFARLLTFPNVVITSHQGFFTREALHNIAETTLANVSGYSAGEIPEQNLVGVSLLAR